MPPPRRRGVTLAVHPHSHHTSLVLTAPQYDRLLAATEESGLMFNPDTGHILRGGHDPLARSKRVCRVADFGRRIRRRLDEALGAIADIRAYFRSPGW